MLHLLESPNLWSSAPFWFLAPLGAVCALLFAIFFYGGLMRNSEGEPEMVRIAQAVREGAYAYLAQQRNKVILVFIILIGVLIAMAFGGLQDILTPLGVAIAGLLSGLCGWFGMKTATNASARTTAAAKKSLDSGLKVAFRAGAVMGLSVVGFALLDVSVWFFLLYQIFEFGSLVDITTVTMTFAMGASLQALFARVGGGIYTKAADVGADLVGKVEAGIPEDDARNPATIADNVGDNVGDVAGMGADLYESYYGSILAAMALAAAACVGIFAGRTEEAAAIWSLKLVAVPPAIAGLGILCSIIAVFLVKAKEGASFSQLLKSLHAGVWFSSALIIGLSAILLYLMLGPSSAMELGLDWWRPLIAITVGLLGGLVIAWGTEKFTSYEYAPTQRIAEQAETGPATVIISGVAEGMRSTWIPLITTVVAILLAFSFCNGSENFLLGIFGVSIAAVGMLSTLGITLATDAYGPIADNAGGNAEMTHQPDFVRERTDMLDSLGNTTAATGKGFAIGSAALTALALLAAFAITVRMNLNSMAVDGNPQAFYNDFPQGDIEDPKAEHYARYIGGGLFTLATSADAPGKVGGLISDRGVQTVLDEGYDENNWAKVTRDPGTTVWAGNFKGVNDTMQLVEITPIPEASLPQVLAYYDVTLMNPRVLSGLFIGVMMVFVFCAMTMNAVGRAAFAMMQECRRQFTIMKKGFKSNGMSDEEMSDPTNWPFEVTVDGKSYPDYASCVTISTSGALREMVIPSVMAVVIPIAVGIVLGVAGVMGMLAGALVCGFAVAIFMANAGGAWDNAKKYIETGKHGGKGSDAHKAGVVGDTVGDPFKDTSGPALNILIKLVSVVSVVFAGLTVKLSPIVLGALGLG
ncbi:MAG: V-type H(+)-translocating pyrophosphatase [Planctomycetes bacterium TMED75]|nr:V-type H(+)-translocating pyrophosphatase [Planctomycetaceae bacterium]OUU95841.1 MAG: V-type H(+)-translocating pyrophosphatase [Planctomycetes bacterium TMED75]